MDKLAEQIQIAEHWLKCGDLAQARSLLESIVRERPKHGPATELLASILAYEGKLPQATDLLLKLARHPDCSASIKIALGDLYLEQGNFELAVHQYASALKAVEPFFEVLHNLGLAYAKLFLFKEAVEQFEKAALINRASFELQMNWGAALKNLGQYQESLEHLFEAEKIEPHDPRVWLNKGVTLEALDRQREALVCYQTAIGLNPNYLEAHCNKANSFMVTGEYEQALKAFQQALALNPNDPDTLYNLSFLQLSQGNYADGWQNYEHRWHRENAPKKPFNHIPALINLDDLTNKNILVWSEQGLGDSLQFCRYIPRLIEMGAIITVATQPQLIEILKTLKGVRGVISIEDKPPVECDAQVSMLSLPFLFSQALIPTPSSIPYLSANPNKTREWHERLKSLAGLKVGLVWNGGFRAKQPELWAINARRNIPLTSIAKLKDIAGIQFFSLQKGDPAESELLQQKTTIWPSENLSIFTPELETFEDTAALIENLDLVITVDTSTAHLVGALGKPVWILNRYDSCWRWLINQETSHWYPNARLFIQPSPGNWDAVMEMVALALQNLASSHSKQ